MFSTLQLPFGTWTSTLLAVSLVSALPLLVTLLMARQEVLLRRWLPQLTAFGAGAVLGAAVGHLIPEALQMGQSPATVAVGVLAGLVTFWAIERALAGHDHAHAHGVPLGAPSAHESDDSEAACVHLHPTPAGSRAAHASRALAPMAFVGDALHNFIDGALIAAGFLAEPSVGVLTLIAVGLHELPREVGTFSLFVHGGIRPMRAVMYNVITAVIAMVGASVTLVIGARFAALTMLLVPFAAGTYLYIAQAVGRAALHDTHRDAAHWARLAWSAAGTVLMLGLVK
jgi:zinc and cadmium transporter